MGETITVKTYEIGGRTYEQRPLVLGQIRQLEQLLADVPWDKAVSAAEMLRLLGDRLPLAAAIVLRPKRPWPLRLLYEPRRKNIRRLAARLTHELDLTIAYQVVADFFTCNPVRSFLARLAGVLQETGAVPTTVSKPPASCSAAPTSPSSTPCCGDAPLQNASPISASGSATCSTAKPSSPSSA